MINSRVMGGWAVRGFGSQWSASSGVGDPELAEWKVAALKHNVDRVTDLKMVRWHKA
jgi:hypothetical protein